MPRSTKSPDNYGVFGNDNTIVRVDLERGIELKLCRILFVGPMGKGSTCVPRARGLESLGHDVLVLDTADVYGRSMLEKRIGLRFFVTPTVIRMNATLLDTASKYRPDVVWMEKADWVYLTTLKRLRRHARFMVHYNTDDLFSWANHFWLARRGLGHFSAHLTTNRFNVLEIPRYAKTRTFRAGMGFDQDLHTRPKNQNQVSFDSIVFVGHWEPHTEKYIVAMKRAGLHVKVWGHNWRHASTTELRSVKPLEQERYAATICDAAMVLCSLSRKNRNESTGRSFEIPAIGGCLLAERTREHEFIYKDGVDAILFSDCGDLVQKARYYLAHGEERRAVAGAGHDRCVGLELSWAGHMRREWPLLEKMLLTREAPERGRDDAPFWPGFRSGEPFDGM